MVTVSWTATPGVTYSLQYKSNLLDSVWKDIAGYVTASGGTASKEDFLGLGPQRFYRARIVSDSPVIGPLTLAPGASANFTASFTAPINSCSVSSTVTATGSDNCTQALVTNTASATCPLITTPGIKVTKVCPAQPVSPGQLLTFSGSVSNTGNVTLTNIVVVNNQPVANTAVFTVASLAPGAISNFTGSYLAPANCSVADTLTATGQSICGVAVTNMVTANCPILTTPVITITESCPPGPVTNGSSVVFGGSVCNSGNISLTNIFVFSGQPSNILVLGPITLAPGACAPFTGSYLATGGCNPLTNSIIMTNSRVIITPTNTVIVTPTNTVIVTPTNMVTVTTNNPGTITTNHPVTVMTNTVTPTFGTIDPLTGILTDRFNVPSNLHGLMYADQNVLWGPTLFYSTQHPGSGADTFDTISTVNAPAYAGSQYVGFVTNEYNLTLTGYDALTLAAPNVGYGEVNFYYVRHDNSGVTHFGVIKGAPSDGDLPNPIAGTGYTGLAFAAANVGYGDNMFYYVRNDTNGLSWFGSIDPTPGLAATDLYTVGTNTSFDALVYVDLAPITGWGTDYFAYLRHDNIGSIIGTIDPVTHVATDRWHLGTNFLSALTFTTTQVGYGPNLFYYLRPAGTTFTTNTNTTYTTNTVTTYTTNTVTTYTTNTVPGFITNTVPGFITNTVTIYTTNSVVSFTPTNTVTASGMDICQVPVTAAANCGCGTSAPPVLIIGTPKVNSDGFFGLSFLTEQGKSYYVQYKDTLTDPTWTNLPGMPVPGTGGSLTIYDPSPAALHPSRFYRVMSTP
jgi:hypothetical protein